MSRSTRKQPFCWQEKEINRIIRKVFTNKSLKSKMILLYATLTEIDSDFNNKDIKYYTKTISTYSGLSKNFIPTGIKELEKFKIIEVKEERKNGKVLRRVIKFTPQKLDKTHPIEEETLPKPNTSKPDISKPDISKPNIRKQSTLEDSTILEDSILKEDTPYGSADAPQKESLSEKTEGQEINEVLSEFFKATTVLDREGFYGRKTYRDASKQLVAKFGLPETLKLVRVALSLQGEKYSPLITNPVELRDKIDKLYLYIKSENNVNAGGIGMGTDFSKS